LIKIGHFATYFSDPSVDALMVAFGSHSDDSVKLWRCAHHESACKGSIGCVAFLGTACKVEINRFLKSLFDFLHGYAVKGYNIADVRNTSDETTIIFVNQE